jgi:hypothetical protein
MGVIALLRQTYLDAQWYKTNRLKKDVNMSLQAWNDNQNLPQIFEADDKWNDIRADRVGDEFGVQYIIKGGGNEYQRIKEIANQSNLYPIAQLSAGNGCGRPERCKGGFAWRYETLGTGSVQSRRI